MFANDRQKCQVIRILLAGVCLQDWWSATGPTAAAYGPDDALLGCLSHGEQVLVAVVWDVWSGDGGARLADVLSVLDHDNARRVLSLFMAANESAEHVNMWIDTHAPILQPGDQLRRVK